MRNRMIRSLPVLPVLLLWAAAPAWSADLQPAVVSDIDHPSGGSKSDAPNDADAWQPKGPARRDPPPPAPPLFATPPPAAPKPTTPPPAKAAEALPSAPKPLPGVTPPPTVAASESETTKKFYLPNSPSVNKLVGIVTSLDVDAKLIRINVEGDVNPQISYDDRTVALQDGIQFPLAELEVGDQVTIRYIGKDFTARAVERTAKAAASKPAASESALDVSTSTVHVRKAPAHHAKKK